MSGLSGKLVKQRKLWQGPIQQAVQSCCKWPT